MWLEIHQLCINKSTNGGRNERWRWEGGGASKESKKRTMEMDCRRYGVGLWCCIRAELDGPTWLFHVWIKSTRLWPMLHSVDSAYVQNWQSRFSSSWTAEGFLADSSLGTREAHSLYAKRSHFHYLPLTLEIGTYGSPLTYLWLLSKFMLSSSLLQLLFTDICYAFQSPSYPPGSSHPPLLLFSASSQVVAVHRLSCSQVGIHSLYKGKISSLPLLFLLFSPLLVSLFLQTELAMSSLLIFLSVLTLFSLLSTIALAPSKE